MHLLQSPLFFSIKFGENSGFWKISVIAWQPYLYTFGRCLLSFYFLKAGVNNAINFNKVINLVRSKKIPFAAVALAIVVFIEIFASLAIIFNYFVIMAATALILFTITVNFLICNYWEMEGLQRKHVSFVFYANFAVVGALLIMIAMQ